MADRIEVHAQADFLWNGYKVFVVQGGEIFAIERRPLVDGEVDVDPTFSARDGKEFLQAALDCAWGVGFRPTGFRDTAEQVKAMDRHLQDMRAITFAKLQVPKP